MTDKNHVADKTEEVIMSAVSGGSHGGMVGGC
jgi:hypothetical protein